MQIGPPPNKSFQGLSIIFNGCAERHLLLDMSSLTRLVQQAEASGQNEKNLHKRSAEAFFRDGHTLGACSKLILLDSTFYQIRIRSA